MNQIVPPPNQKFLLSFTFHFHWPFSHIPKSQTGPDLLAARAKILENEVFNMWPSPQWSSQNLVHSPLPTQCTNPLLATTPDGDLRWRKSVIFFQTGETEALLGIVGDRLYSILPYLASISFLHSASFSFPYLHTHLHRNASFLARRFPRTRPPYLVCFLLSYPNP